MSDKTFNIGLAGLGTVGINVIKLIESNQTLIEKKSGCRIEVLAISARNKSKDRGLNIKKYKWVDNPLDLPGNEKLDAIVEVIGGTADPAKTLIEQSLAMKKHVVTANKALLAERGTTLAQLSEKFNVALRFEAAVAGGIPIIKALMTGISSNNVQKISGVMNGTCNYILSRMETENCSYQDAFSEAQKLGYVEADPRLDVGGVDAAQKLAILSSISFQADINFEDIEIEGIEQVTLADIQNAKAMGYKIKLIGTSELNEKGLYQIVQPCLVKETSTISKLEGGTNMISIESDFIGQTSYIGPGAGGGPTASSIVSDLIEIARGESCPVFGVETTKLKKYKKVNNNIEKRYYLRLLIIDKPGSLAKVATALGDNQVSIDRMRQVTHDGDEAPLIIVTHQVTRLNLNNAISGIKNLDVCLARPVAFQIEEI